MTTAVLTAPPARPRRHARRRWAIAAGIVASLVAAPVLAVAVNLFLPSQGSLGHLWATILPEVLANTLGLMACVAAGTALIGVGTAWLVTMTRFPASRAFETALLLPLAMPAYIIGYAYTDFLAFAGPLQGTLRAAFGWTRADYRFPDIHSVPGVSLMLTLVLYPYVYLLARAAFLEQSVCTLEAARTLGAGPWRRFVAIALPLARPAIAAGVALALMEALADFGTVQYFGVTTFTTVIYRTWFGMGDRVAAAQLSTALLLMVFLLLALERASRGERRFHHTSRRLRPLAPPRLRGAGAVAAVLACALPVLLGFVLPVLILLRLHLADGDELLASRFLRVAGSSFLVAGIAAATATATALVLGYALREARGAWTTIAIRVATMGYAIPGTVIAVGVLIPLAAFDNALDAWMRAAFGVSTGLLLSGGLAALIFAYLVRFLSVAVGAVEAGLGRITLAMDDAARTLGAGTLKLGARVHAPLMKGSVLTAATIVFVDVLKELPATLLIRPFNFETLAVRVFSYASDERLAQAATSALAIVAVGVVPVAILSAVIRRARAGGPAIETPGPPA